MTRLPATLFWMAATAAACLFLWLGHPPLLDWDENIYAEAARQMVSRGEYISLWVNGQPFVEKPPLVLWQMAAFFQLFGVGEWQARAVSAVNGLLTLGLLGWMGAKLGGRRLALLWPAVYFSAFMPQVLARSAVIDHTFNGLIALAAFALYFYEDARQAPHPSGRHTAGWAALATLAMGLAVLTKGPLGGVIPLVGYAGMKAARKEWRVHLGHFALMGAGSLAIGASWYIANYLRHGQAFLEGFSRFQGQLFSTPLDGHTGPLLYHFGVALVGLFPWTPLLLAYLNPKTRALFKTEPLKGLAGLLLAWAAFVLGLFTLVQTKLPHYSSSIYVPLSLLAALALAQWWQEGAPAPRWLAWLFGGYGLLLGGLFGLAPYLMEGLAAKAGLALAHPPQPEPLAFLPGLGLALGLGLAAWWLRRAKIPQAAAAAGLAMGLFMAGVWRVHLPMVAAYNQGPAMAMMERAHQAGGDLAMYRTLSFAVIFYGGQEVEMLDSYKFTGHPERLDQAGPRPLYVISPASEAEPLRRAHPLLQPVYQDGRLALQVIPAAPQTR